MSNALRPWLERCPLVAILRGLKPDEAIAMGEAIVGNGIPVLEVPLNSPQPLESIRLLADMWGETAGGGAGRVIPPAVVARIAAVGGRLIVTPHADPAVTRAAKEHGLLAVPGFLTPTEAFALLAAGADGLKLFPAEAASPAVLKAMLAVLPKGTSILPVGGIGATNMEPWKAAGAAGFGIASALFKPGDSPAVVAERAKTLHAACG
jgi:2-dehydro-3-deoxyphosphogalactonate aldolase